MKKNILFLITIISFLAIGVPFIYAQNSSFTDRLLAQIDGIRQQIIELQQRIALILSQQATFTTNLSNLTPQQTEYVKKLEKRVLELEAFQNKLKANPIPNISRYLTIGSQDTTINMDVANWQTYLENLGLLSLPLGVNKGYFGTLTSNATKNWKRAVGADLISPIKNDVNPITLTWIRAKLASDNTSIFGPKSTTVLYGSITDILPFPSEGPAGTQAQLCFGNALRKELKDALRVPTFEVDPQTANLWLSHQTAESNWCAGHALPAFPVNQLRANFNLNTYE